MQNKNKLISSFILLLLFGGCSSENTVVPEQVPAIVVITKEAPESKDYTFPGTTMKVLNKGNIVYTDTSLNLVHRKLNALPYDTITIDSNRDNFEIRHDYSAFEAVYYLLNRGDTLLLSYTDGYMPYAQILNRPYNDTELNVDYSFFNQMAQPDDLFSVQSALKYYSFMSSLDAKYLLMKEAAEERYASFRDNQRSYLDSLWNNHAISEAYYRYKKDYIDGFHPSDSLFLKHDSLIYFDFYRSLIFKEVFSAKTPTAQSKFDNVVYSPDYSNAVKKYVVQLIADDLRTDLSSNELTKRLTDYKEITGDSATYSNLSNEFGLLTNSPLKVVVNKTPDVPKEELIDSLIARYKGNVVVVDFWATWCRPCLAAAKKIEPLKQELQDQPVVFVYITDTSSPPELWEEKIREMSGEHYYLNKDQWNYTLQKLNIKGIPFYSIYNKDGKLIERFTGYPGNEKLKESIESGN